MRIIAFIITSALAFDMSDFDFEGFITKPSLSILNLCRKVELLEIAGHFDLSFSKPILKRDLKALIMAKMAELGHTLLPTQTETHTLDSATAGKSDSLLSGDGPHGASANGRKSDKEGGQEKTQFTLPCFDPLSEASSDSRLGGSTETTSCLSPAGGTGKDARQTSPVASGNQQAGNRG